MNSLTSIDNPLKWNQWSMWNQMVCKQHINDYQHSTFATKVLLKSVLYKNYV